MAYNVNGNSLRAGFVIKYNGGLYRVMSAEHRTPGNLRAFMQAKLRNLKDGRQTEARFRADESVERVVMEQMEMEYLYNDSSGYCFMNIETFEQIFLDEEVVADAKLYLMPNIKVRVELCEDNPIGVELPEIVELKVMACDPQMKGATATGSNKPATLETGLVVGVPQFIEVGQMIRVSTTSGEYLERVKA